MIAGNIWHRENPYIPEAAQAAPFTIVVTRTVPASAPEPPPAVYEAPVDDHRYRDHDRWRDRDRWEDRENRRPPPPKPNPSIETARALQEMNESMARKMEVIRKPLSDFMPQRPPVDPNHVPAAGEISPNMQRLFDYVEAGRRQTEAIAAAGRTPSPAPPTFQWPKAK
jgi:hypothetical protein